MNQLLVKLLGIGPYPFPLDQIEDYARYYESEHINLVITKVNISFTAGPQVHSHDSYEFFIPFQSIPNVCCGEKHLFVPKDMILPINPFQEHGPGDKYLKGFFVAVHVESEFMRRVAQSIYGEARMVFTNQPVPLKNELKILIRKFAEEAAKQKTGNKLILECLSTQIAVQFIRDLLAVGESESVGKRTSKRSLDSVVNSFNENDSGRHYSTQSAAREANLSKYHFIRAFRSETGKTPYNYLLDRKINKAKKLLIETDRTITEICFLCGFINHSHFTSTFKKKTSMSPSLFRKSSSLG